MKVGWTDCNASPDSSLGKDDLSFAFDGYLCKKWNAGPEPYGKRWKAGDVIGCFLDLNDRTISKKFDKNLKNFENFDKSLKNFYKIYIINIILRLFVQWRIGFGSIRC